MVQQSSKVVSHFEALCNYVDFTQGHNNSVLLVAYHSTNVLNELKVDLAKKFTTLNIVEISAKQPSENFIEIPKLINSLSKKAPELLIVNGYKNETVNLNIILLSKEFYCPILLLLPKTEMVSFKQRHGGHFVGEPYFEF